jgi:tripartite-type tricarboxylate transporter receptor subunit TctC
MVVRSMNHIAAVCILVAPTVWAPFIGAPAAETYPSRPLRIIVPAVAGGAADVVARSLGLKMAESWRQQVIVDNRSGIIGAELAAQAAANGYTLMLATSALIVRECVYANLNYSTLRDFAPVSQLFTQANVLVVHPALGVRSVQDLVRLLRRDPDNSISAPAARERRITSAASCLHCSRVYRSNMSRIKAFPRRLQICLADVCSSCLAVL